MTNKKLTRHGRVCAILCFRGICDTIEARWNTARLFPECVFRLVREGESFDRVKLVVLCFARSGSCHASPFLQVTAMMLAAKPLEAVVVSLMLCSMPMIA